MRDKTMHDCYKSYQPHLVNEVLWEGTLNGISVRVARYGVSDTIAQCKETSRSIWIPVGDKSVECLVYEAAFLSVRDR